MSGNGTKLNDGQEAAIAALLTAPSRAKAAKQAGISPATLQRWLREPEFQASYRSARAQLVEDAITRLQRAASKATRTLVRNLTCGKPTVEVRAAATLLDQALKVGAMMDLMARIEAVELKQTRHEQPERPRTQTEEPGADAAGSSPERPPLHPGGHPGPE